MMHRAGVALVVVAAVGCHKTAPPAPAPDAAPAAAPAAAVHLLPGTHGQVTVDLLAYDRARNQVWVPVGETASVDVFDVRAGAFKSVGSFKTAEREAHGRKRTMGPSAAAVGDGFVYVSDRASNEVCLADDGSLGLGACVALSSAPDVIAYVPSAKEIWVTTPKENSIAVLDASKPDAPKPKLTIKTDGSPECFAVDETRGIFRTNLEDKNRTLAIDIATHAVKDSWALGCSDGPRGVAVDAERNFVFVACTDGVEVYDGANGARLARLETGDGVDAIEYFAPRKRLYVAAGKAARLTVAEFGPHGEPAIVSTTTTAPGARNAVVDSRGNAYLVDPRAGRLLVYPAPP